MNSGTSGTYTGDATRRHVAPTRDVTSWHASELREAFAVLLGADLAAREALGQDVLRGRPAPRAAAPAPEQHDRRDEQGPEDRHEDPPVVVVMMHVSPSVGCRC